MLLVVEDPGSKDLIDWKLENIILRHLELLVYALDDPATKTVPEDIWQFVHDALSSIDKFICKMKWDSPERNLEKEKTVYEEILDVLESIQDRRPIPYASHPGLIKTLNTALSHFNGEDGSTAFEESCRNKFPWLLSKAGESTESPGESPET